MLEYWAEQITKFMLEDPSTYHKLMIGTWLALLAITALVYVIL